MSINLNNMYISLDDFNAAASGKYNIGQIKLNEDGTSVYRTNTHKTWTIFNTTEISQEEAFAVKDAFCRAVKSEAKLDDAAVNELKEKLGIGKDKFESMRAGTMKALTAAEVREVIDKYADAINKNRGSGEVRLETSSDIYKNVSEKTLASRAKTRDKVNAQTFKKTATEADSSLSAVLDIMDYKGGDSISKDSRKLARELCKHIWKDMAPGMAITPYKNAPVKLFVQTDRTFGAKVTLQDGSDFNINLGLNQKQLQDRLLSMLDSIAVENRFEADTQKRAYEIQFGEKPPEPDEEALKTKKKPVDPLSLSKPQVDALKRGALNSLKEAMDTIKSMNPRNPKDLIRYRNKDDRMENLVIALQDALVAVRGHDPRNALLINKVRDVFHFDANAKMKAPVDRNALCDEIYRQFSEVLNKERANPRDDIENNIEKESKVGNNPQAGQQVDNDADDDGFEPLNINAILGNTDRF